MAIDTMEIFETLAPLHENPVAFEEKLSEIIDQIVAGIEDQVEKQRVRAFFWSKKAKLDRIHDPQERLNQAIKDFWEGFEQFRVALNDAVNKLGSITNADKTITQITGPKLI